MGSCYSTIALSPERFPQICLNQLETRRTSTIDKSKDDRLMCSLETNRSTIRPSQSSYVALSSPICLSPIKLFPTSSSSISPSPRRFIGKVLKNKTITNEKKRKTVNFRSPIVSSRISPPIRSSPTSLTSSPSYIQRKRNRGILNKLKVVAEKSVGIHQRRLEQRREILDRERFKSVRNYWIRDLLNNQTESTSIFADEFDDDEQLVVYVDESTLNWQQIRPRTNTVSATIAQVETATKQVSTFVPSYQAISYIEQVEFTELSDDDDEEGEGEESKEKEEEENPNEKEVEPQQLKSTKQTFTSFICRTFQRLRHGRAKCTDNSKVTMMATTSTKSSPTINSTNINNNNPHNVSSFDECGGKPPALPPKQSKLRAPTNLPAKSSITKLLVGSKSIGNVAVAVNRDDSHQLNHLGKSPINYRAKNSNFNATNSCDNLIGGIRTNTKTKSNGSSCSDAANSSSNSTLSSASSISSFHRSVTNRNNQQSKTNNKIPSTKCLYHTETGKPLTSSSTIRSSSSSNISADSGHHSVSSSSSTSANGSKSTHNLVVASRIPNGTMLPSLIVKDSRPNVLRSSNVLKNPTTNGRNHTTTISSTVSTMTTTNSVVDRSTIGLPNVQFPSPNKQFPSIAKFHQHQSALYSQRLQFLYGTSCTNSTSPHTATTNTMSVSNNSNSGFKNLSTQSSSYILPSQQHQQQSRPQQYTIPVTPNVNVIRRNSILKSPNSPLNSHHHGFNNAEQSKPYKRPGISCVQPTSPRIGPQSVNQLEQTSNDGFYTANYVRNAVNRLNSNSNYNRTIPPSNIRTINNKNINQQQQQQEQRGIETTKSGGNNRPLTPPPALPPKGIGKYTNHRIIDYNGNLTRNHKSPIETIVQRTAKLHLDESDLMNSSGLPSATIGNVNVNENDDDDHHHHYEKSNKNDDSYHSNNNNIGVDGNSLTYVIRRNRVEVNNEANNSNNLDNTMRQQRSPIKMMMNKKETTTKNEEESYHEHGRRRGKREQQLEQQRQRKTEEMSFVEALVNRQKSAVALTQQQHSVELRNGNNNNNNNNGDGDYEYIHQYDQESNSNIIGRHDDTDDDVEMIIDEMDLSESSNETNGSNGRTLMNSTNGDGLNNRESMHSDLSIGSTTSTTSSFCFENMNGRPESVNGGTSTPGSCSVSQCTPISTPPNTTPTRKRTESSASCSTTTLSTQESNKDFLIDDEIADQPDLFADPHRLNRALFNLPLNQTIRSRPDGSSPSSSSTVSSSAMATPTNNPLRTASYELESLIRRSQHDTIDYNSLPLSIDNGPNHSLRVDRTRSFDQQSPMQTQQQLDSTIVEDSNSISICGSPRIANLRKRHSYTSSSSCSPPQYVQHFRRPRPLSFVENEDGSLGFDSPSQRAVQQDIIGLKTLLFRLQNVLQNAETQNPFESSFRSNRSSSFNHHRDRSCSNGSEQSVDNEQTDSKHQHRSDKEMIQCLREETFDLKQHIQLLEQEMIEKDRTIRLLQQQMAKYTTGYVEPLNVDHSTSNDNREMTNSTTQTESNSEEEGGINPRAMSDGSNGQLIRPVYL